MSGSREQNGTNLNGLHLYLFRGEAPGWPSNGAPRSKQRGKHFDAEVVILPQGHAVRLSSDNRTLAEYVTSAQPGPDPVVEMEILDSERGGMFSNDRLLYRAEHGHTAYPDDAAYAAAAQTAAQALRDGGAVMVDDPDAPDDADDAGSVRPLVSVLAREHELEVRALYRDAANRTLLQWVSVVGLKLKLRR